MPNPACKEPERKNRSDQQGKAGEVVAGLRRSLGHRLSWGLGLHHAILSAMSVLAVSRACRSASSTASTLSAAVPGQLWSD